MVLAQTSKYATCLGRHALVIGGSLAGLLVTRVLAESFEKVTCIERDMLTDAAAHRKGVPQSRHAHGLLAGGFEAMQQLFPDFAEELVHAGALLGDLVGDVLWYQYGAYKAQCASGLRGIMCSRPLLESAVRRRVLAMPNVQMFQGCAVLGLLASPDGSRVTGVRLVHGTDGSQDEVQADLVVDASGRGSKSPAWLAALGYDKPETGTVPINAGSTSRLYRRKPEALSGALGAIIGPRPPHQKRSGVIMAIEHDRWIVTLSGRLGDHAPTDAPDYLAFAQSLSAPDIYDVIKDAEPLSEPVAYKFPASVRHYYERLARFPMGYLVCGDALCSFNPAYAQGMSVAALEALSLRQCLHDQGQAGNLTGLSQRFFPHAATVLDTLWTMVTSTDLNFLEVPGKGSLRTHFHNWYISKIHQAARRDQAVCRAFFAVANLLQPPSSLFHPKIMTRVIKESLRG